MPTEDAASTLKSSRPTMSVSSDDEIAWSVMQTTPPPCQRIFRGAFELSAHSPHPRPHANSIGKEPPQRVTILRHAIASAYGIVRARPLKRRAVLGVMARQTGECRGDSDQYCYDSPRGRSTSPPAPTGQGRLARLQPRVLALQAAYSVWPDPSAAPLYSRAIDRKTASQSQRRGAGWPCQPLHPHPISVSRPSTL